MIKKVNGLVQMFKDLDKFLHQFLHPSQELPDFKMYPEHRPWPLLYLEMLRDEPKTYIPALLNDMKRAVLRSLESPSKISLWERFNSSMAWDAGEHYIWHRVIAYRATMTQEEREQEAKQWDHLTEEIRWRGDL